MNGPNLLVAALENDGVKQIFGVPGEESLDIIEALRRSTIGLSHHEQAAAYALPAVRSPAKRITEPGRSGSPHRRVQHRRSTRVRSL
jgi:hypothetical protein